MDADLRAWIERTRRQRQLFGAGYRLAIDLWRDLLSHHPYSTFQAVWCGRLKSGPAAESIRKIICEVCRCEPKDLWEED